MQPSLSKIKDYPKFLNDHWALHLAPRAKDAPTVISTFAGCGGSSLGYSFAGFKELLAVEWDQNAVDTFRLNFPDVPVYHGDIKELSVDQCLEMTGLEVGELDVFDGSPPCQGFSTAGKRIMQDERNFLFREYCRLLKGLQPKTFVMENVSGMVKGKMKLVFAEILRELKSCGYKVKAVLMNAMYFGVPQSRQRMIFIGVRNDKDIEPSHPLPQYYPPTFAEAAQDVNADEEVRQLPEFLLEVAKCQPIKWDTDDKHYARIKGNTASSISLKWAIWNRYVGTLPKSEISCTGIVHPDRQRYISLSEGKRLGAFPDDYQFLDRSSGLMRIGNSVPPLFMKAIAEHIRKDILHG